jgi:hypothetical protein
MSCKCGTRVKASVNETGITTLGVRQLDRQDGLRSDLATSDWFQPLQELGTIETGSKVDIAVSWKE